MKQYDRETKQWLDEEVIKTKRTKRKLCKGGREHDWMLCLPSYVRTNGTILGFDKVEEYYKIEDEREDALIAFDERLERIGIKIRYYNVRKLFGRRRSYICSVCQKQKSE